MTGLSPGSPKVVEAYWHLVDEMVFGKGSKRVGKAHNR